MEAMLTMRPRVPSTISCWRICVIADLQPSQTLLQLMSIVRSNCSSVEVVDDGVQAGEDAGIVDHDVESAERLDGAIDHCLDVSRLTGVGVEVLRLPAVGADDVVGVLLGVVLVAAGEAGLADVGADDVGALSREGEGDGAAVAGAGAGDGLGLCRGSRAMVGPSHGGRRRGRAAGPSG